MQHERVNLIFKTVLLMIFSASLIFFLTGCAPSPSESNHYLWHYRDSELVNLWRNVPSWTTFFTFIAIENGDEKTENGTLVKLHEGKRRRLKRSNWAGRDVEACKVTIVTGDHRGGTFWTQCRHMYERGTGPMALETAKE
ncbi:hypothetical protein KGY71_02400 [Candidatus Bipolaricaulota bacterium]|nr:hypothetical protein [Candidatus Bipolaricaulota bacterium]